MNQQSEKKSKFTIIGFLWTAQGIAFMIRFALPIAAPTLRRLYHLSQGQMGDILAGWNYAYTLGLPLMGILVDLVGPWLAMGGGLIVWGVSTLALPLATTFTSLFIMRFLFGLGHTPIIPVTAASVSRHFPVKERTRAIAVAFSGNQVGLAVGAGVASVIMAKFGWHAVFYVMGGVTLLFAVAWFLWFPDKSVGRRLNQSGGADTSARVKWSSLLRYRSTWGIAFGQFGYLYAYYFFISWLPSYLVDERHMTVLSTGLYSALTFSIGMLGTLGGGWLGDYLIARGITTTVSRKGIIAVGLCSSTVFVVSAAYVDAAWIAAVLVALSVGFLRLATGSCNSLPVDLAPRSAVASLTSVQNFMGNVGGLLAPILTGRIVDRTGSFVPSLLLAGGMALFGAISYVFVVGNIEKDRLDSGPA